MSVLLGGRLISGRQTLQPAESMKQPLVTRKVKVADEVWRQVPVVVRNPLRTQEGEGEIKTKVIQNDFKSLVNRFEALRKDDTLVNKDKVSSALKAVDSLRLKDNLSKDEKQIVKKQEKGGMGQRTAAPQGKSRFKEKEAAINKGNGSRSKVQKTNGEPSKKAAKAIAKKNSIKTSDVKAHISATGKKLGEGKQVVGKSQAVAGKGKDQKEVEPRKSKIKKGEAVLAWERKVVEDENYIRYIDSLRERMRRLENPNEDLSGIKSEITTAETQGKRLKQREERLKKVKAEKAEKCNKSVSKKVDQKIKGQVRNDVDEALSLQEAEDGKDNLVELDEILGLGGSPEAGGDGKGDGDDVDPEIPFRVAEIGSLETRHVSDDDTDTRYVDALGAPYCGYVAVAWAAGDVLKRKEAEMIAGNGSVKDVVNYAAQLGFNCVVRDAVGNVIRSNKYDDERWIHLKLVVFGERGEVVPRALDESEDGSGMKCHYLVGVGKHCHSDNLYIPRLLIDSQSIYPLWNRVFDSKVFKVFKWFVLPLLILLAVLSTAYEPGVECESPYGIAGTSAPSVSPTSSPTMDPIPTPVDNCRSRPGSFHWHVVVSVFTLLVTLGFVIIMGYSQKIRVTASVARPNSSDKDVRTVSAQRERLKHHDASQVVSFDVQHFVYGMELVTLPSTFAGSLLGSRYVDRYTVSSKIFLDVFKNISIMAALRKKDAYAAVEAVPRYREVNTPIMLFADTGLCLMRIADLVRDGLVLDRPSVANAERSFESDYLFETVYAEDPRTGIMPDLANVGSQLASKLRGNGSNYVSKGYRIVDSGQTKVGNFPLGTFTTNQGPLGRRGESATTSIDSFMAFVGRAMNNDANAQNDFLLNDFLKFSKDFIDDMMSKIDFSDVVEPQEYGSENTVEDFFRQHYRGKRTSASIDAVMASWKKHLDGTMCVRERKRWRRNSFFVKAESNLKEVMSADGKFVESVKVKPRGIMTMCDMMLVTCSPVLILINKILYSDVMRQFHIKEISQEEMVQKVVELTESKYQVTDYSSYEASIYGGLREVEEYFIKRACDEAGFLRTKRYFEEFTPADRTLWVQWGTFHIRSRCSGDFWTSFGNGILSTCIMAYCHKVNNCVSDFAMIAEGDDGLVSQETPNVSIIRSLGLKFSSSVSGTAPGDADFLQSLWEGNGMPRHLNLGRTLASLLFVRNSTGLKKTKQLYILRCKAQSLYHLSPGHPVLSPLIVTIGKMTSGLNSFKGVEKYLDSWKNESSDTSSFPRAIKINENMRHRINQGAVGFPPITYCEQMYLEHIFSLCDPTKWYLGDIFLDYPALTFHQYEIPALTGDFDKLLKLFEIRDTRLVEKLDRDEL